MTAEPVGRHQGDGYRPAVRPRPRDRARRAGRTGVLAAERTVPAGRRQATAAPIPAPRRAPDRVGARRRARNAPPVPVAAPRAPFVALVLGLVAAGIVGLLLLNTAINTNSVALRGLRDKQASLDAQEQQLNRELAERESPGSLQAAATRMGLVPAGATAFIRLPDGTVIGVPQPAPAAGTGSR